jgi:effector-binding domain-containing protein
MNSTRWSRKVLPLLIALLTCCTTSEVKENPARESVKGLEKAIPTSTDPKEVAQKFAGPYLREFNYSARVETTADWPEGWVKKARDLESFAKECGATVEGPLVVLDVRLPDMVDSVRPSAELVYAIAGPDDLPEGGEDMALLRVIPCQVVATRIKGNHHDVLGALPDLVDWAEQHGHEIELRPGIILASPEIIESGGAMELFYPLRQELKMGEFSFCSPGLGSEK